MPRRLLVALLTAGLASAAWVSAAEQATFVLRDGHRVSGALATHGRLGTNVRTEFGEFSLATNEGLELVIPITRVSVIDFAGGNPAVNELEALPDGGSHMVAFRDGTQREGRLVDFIGGDRARFQVQSGIGRREDIPVRNIARIYLDSASARQLYNYRPNTGGGVFGRGRGNTGGGVFGRGGEPQADAIDVRGAVPWTNTGVRVRVGESMRFNASGSIHYMRSDEASAGPDGNPSMVRKEYPVPDMPVGGLIGRVGPNGTPFRIGSNQGAIRMPATGVLQLGVNDDNFDDNSGVFRVAIRRN